MIRGMHLLVPVLALACGGDSPAPVDDTDLPLPTETDDHLPSDQASLVLFLSPPTYGDPEPQIALGGIFAASRNGYVNLAQCVAFPDRFCVQELPTAPDTYVVAEAFTKSMKDALRTHDVGPRVKLGQYTAPALDTDGHRVYYATAGAMPVPNAMLGLTFGPGQWGEVSVADAVKVPTPLQVSSPNPLLYHTFTDDEPVKLRWAPGGTGDLYLAVVTPRERRLYLLEDDGAFDLDLLPFGLSSADAVDISLSRWSLATVEVDRGEIAIQVQFDQWIHGTWRDLGGRVHLPTAPNTCAEAKDSDSVEPGSYWGRLATHTNTLNPGNNNACTGSSATGRDAFLAYDLEPWEAVDVVYTLPSGDASLYLLGDCQYTNTCLDGSDVPAVSATETASWLNNSDDPRRIYIVLDSNGTDADLFELDITSTILAPDVLVDTCLEAINQGPIAAGVYTGDLSYYSNVLDVGATCGPPAPGAEGIAQVLLQPNQTMTAAVTMPGHNPVLYAMYSCSVLDSCAASADNSAGPSEQLSYTNLSGSTEYLYLVVDGAVFTGQYVLDLQIQ